MKWLRRFRKTNELSTKVRMSIDREGMGELTSIVIGIDKSNVDRLVPGLKLRRGETRWMVVWSHSAVMDFPLSDDTKHLIETLQKYVPVTRCP